LFFIPQAMNVSDIVAHVGVIHCTLRFGFPRTVGGPVVGENAHDVNVPDVLEHVFSRIGQFAAEDEVKTLGQWCRSSGR